MSVQVVEDHPHYWSVGVGHVNQPLHLVDEVLHGASLGDGYVAPSSQPGVHRPGICCGCRRDDTRSPAAAVVPAGRATALAPRPAMIGDNCRIGRATNRTTFVTPGKPVGDRPAAWPAARKHTGMPPPYGSDMVLPPGTGDDPAPSPKLVPISALQLSPQQDAQNRLLRVFLLRDGYIPSITTTVHGGRPEVLRPRAARRFL